MEHRSLGQPSDYPPGMSVPREMGREYNCTLFEFAKHTFGDGDRAAVPVGAVVAVVVVVVVDAARSTGGSDRDHHDHRGHHHHRHGRHGRRRDHRGHSST